MQTCTGLIQTMAHWHPRKIQPMLYNVLSTSDVVLHLTVGQKKKVLQLDKIYIYMRKRQRNKMKKELDYFKSDRYS